MPGTAHKLPTKTEPEAHGYRRVHLSIMADDHRELCALAASRHMSFDTLLGVLISSSAHASRLARHAAGPMNAPPADLARDRQLSFTDAVLHAAEMSDPASEEHSAPVQPGDVPGFVPVPPDLLL
jgi:hypothetical protein